MKRIIFSRLAILPIMAAALFFQSCIYDSTAGDEFYRTLWKSDETPLGPFDASALTLEFLCGEQVSIKTTTAARGAAGPSTYGTYSFDGLTAIFCDLTLEYDASDVRTGVESLADIIGSEGPGDDGRITVTFIEAHRNGDTLFLLWRIEDTLYPFTTALKRLSEYE